MEFHGIYLLVNVDITMEHHNVLLGKLTISMAMFKSYVSHYQRVNPGAQTIPQVPLSHGWDSWKLIPRSWSFHRLGLPLVNYHNHAKSPFCMGQLTISMAILVYDWLCKKLLDGISHKITIKAPFSHGFPMVFTSPTVLLDDNPHIQICSPRFFF